MFSSPNQSDVNTHTIKLTIGLIAISLPFLTSYLAGQPLIQSISASYYAGDWPRNIFVGFLIAISALLFAYNGNNRCEFWLAKIGSVATFLIATFPEHAEHLRWVHGAASFVMFTILALFCQQFYKSAHAKPFPQAKLRATIYAICGIVIVLSMLLVALKGVLPSINRLIFYCETAGLLAFGVAWLVASRTLPGITHIEERASFSVFSSERGH